MAMLLDPDVIDVPAAYPNPVFAVAAPVRLFNVAYPQPVLIVPVVKESPEKEPINVLAVPVVISLPAV